MKNPTHAQIRASLSSRFDRQAIDQLRDELGRLAARVESLESELLRQIQRADLAEMDADFWRDYANGCLGDEENSERPQVGITKAGRGKRVREGLPFRRKGNGFGNRRPRSFIEADARQDALCLRGLGLEGQDIGFFRRDLEDLARVDEERLTRVRRRDKALQDHVAAVVHDRRLADPWILACFHVAVGQQGPDGQADVID